MNKKLFFTHAPILGALGTLLFSTLLAQPGMAYETDSKNHVLTIAPTGDYNTDARKALAYLLQRSDQDTVWTMRFKPGKYYFSRPLYGAKLKNVVFESADFSNPAMLIKKSDFTESEYIIYLKMSEKIWVKGLEFYGLTDFKSNNNPVWPDQGIYFGSSKNIVIDQNHFYNFGNSAIRITTHEKDPVKGVNSFDTTISGNTFNNIYQISTTSNDEIHGGTARLWLKNNKIYNLRGSVKFASRTPGAEGVHILNNVINGSSHYGLEIDNYDDMEILDNTFQNIQEIAINIYTNPRIPKGFNWGNNFNISNNKITKSRRGIRFSPDPANDGYKPQPKNLTISGNTLNTVSETDKFVSAISVVNGVVNGVKITSNTLTGVSNKNYIGIAKGCVNISRANNKAEGKLLDQASSEPDDNNTSNNPPSPSPAPAPTPSGSTGGGTGAPNPPNNLVAKYNGDKQVILTWKDNANNETSMELWGSYNGKDYSRIASMYSNTQKFTHNLKRIPSNPNFYYVVRAMKDSQASKYSNTVKVVFKDSTASSQ